MKRCWIYCCALIALNACFEVDDASFDSAPPTLVIEGKMTNGPGPYQVMVNFSSSFDDVNDNTPAEDAIVRIYDDKGNEEFLVMQSPGIYETTSLRGEIGVVYSLEVTLQGATYTASSRLNPVGAIDSLTSKFHELSALREEGYYVSLYAQKSVQDQINYYKALVYQNGVLLNSRSYLFVASDEFVTQINGVEFAKAFNAGDTVKWELESLSREVYDYYIQLGIILNNDGIVTSSRLINPPTNFTPKVLGVFQASAVSSAEIIIQ